MGAWQASVRALGIVFALCGVVPAAHASGVDPTRVSVPKGPGSIEGLATTDFSPSLASGSSSYEIPIAVPPASAGFGPKLSFAYDSGGGVTELGIGWRLTGTPKVRRRTDDGLPHFDATDTLELVGLGIPSELLEVSPGTYRPAVEDGSFVRVVRSDDGAEWEARTKAGVTLRFGGHGFVEAEADHVSAYLLREEEDHHGHVVHYEWDAAEGHALLTRVVWNEFDPASTNEVRFGYESRPDRYRRFSSGIRETISRRLVAVDVSHGGALVRRYELGYADVGDGSAGAHPALTAVTLVGRDGTSRMPASRFAYTEANLAVSAEGVVTMTDAPGRSPSDPDSTLADVNGDGLPDLLVGKADQFRSYLNHDGKSWLSPVDWGVASPSVSLGAKGVELADLDADGAPDLVVKSGTDSFRYFPGLREGALADPVTIATVPSFSFEDADVRLADMDGDRRIDVVVTTRAGIAVAYNRNGTDFTEPALVGPIDATAPVLFSDGHTSLCDVNGDRVDDLCSLRSGGLSYWLGRGRGLFEPGEAGAGVPEFDESAPYQLVDVNGDGWVDLLRVDEATVSVALGVGEARFSKPVTLDGVPERGPGTAIELADLNGSGTTDIAWVDVTKDATGDGSASWRYIELFPLGRAGLLRRIDNGLGKVQTIEYVPAALQAARARDAGVPWTTRINVAMPVVARVTTDLSLGDPLIVTESTYRDGVYDPAERTFAGFGGGTQRRLGDASTPTLVTDFTFDVGLVHRELRGSPLTEEARDDAGNVFTRTTHRYTSRSVATSLDGRSVGYSFASSELVSHVEGDAAHARETLTEIDQDGYGDVTEERRWGEVSGTDYLVGNDEAIVTRTFANDEAEWLLGHLVTEQLRDGAGRRVSFARKYYDGAAFVGLPLGAVERGDVAREEAWVGPGDADFELVLATAYDDDGLPIETRDARGGGRLFTWASDHTSIRSERVKLESSAVLTEYAEVDGAFGSLLSATDYSGQVTRYEYDSFGRLASVIKPGDSSALPTVRHGYGVGAPLSRIVTERRVTSGAADAEWSESLVDGNGRTRGTLTRAASGWLLAGVSILDERGNARRSLLPRAVDAAGHATPPLLDATPPGSDTFHDALGREVRTRSPSGIETHSEYGPLETRHWDGGQADARSSYEHTPTVERKDGLGRIVAHVRTLAGRELTATYAYDASGALVSRTDPEAHVARYDYDGRGRRIAVHDPDLGEHRFSYDATGDVVARRYPDGVTAGFTFDLAGRSLTEDWDGDGSAELTRTWDVAPDDSASPSYLGRLARVGEPSGSVTHTYDARGRVTSTRYDIDGKSYVVGSEYDAQDRESLHVYPDGSSIAIARNGRGQIASYGAAVTFAYGDDGLETERRFDTGVVVRNAYDDERRRSELTIVAASGSVVEHLRFKYDSGGNLASLSDPRPGIEPARDRSETYGYDNLYRLSGVQGPWGHTEYEYSDSGNLTGRTSSVAAQSLGSVAYGSRPHVPSAFRGTAVEVDERGRMTSDGVRVFTWNAADQLVAVARAQGGAAAGAEESVFGDDGVRRMRVEHRADGTSTTTHFIDAWSEARDGKLVRYIVHAGQRIVQLADTNGASASTSAVASRGGSGRESDARAARFPGLGPLCALAFALTVVLRILLKFRHRELLGVLRLALVAAALGVSAALVVTSGAPGVTAMGVVLVAALCGAKARGVARATRLVVASVAVLAGVAACGGPGVDRASASGPPGTVQGLGEADTILATDLLGSVLVETTGTGKPTTAFATYPFGATRYDTSRATWKFAGTPRDDAVGLDHMGARFYAPDLGVWTSGDPVALTDPERLVTPDFAAANPYAYAKQSPLVAADRDGHFWHVVLGAAVGALFGGGIEAGRQFLAHGRVDDWGRIGAAAAGGAVSGTIMALNPAAGLAEALATGAASNAASGAAERLVASHGKSAGSVTDVAMDAAVGAVTAGVGRGVTGAVRRAVAGRGGPLAEDVASSFRGGKYHSKVLGQDVLAYRYSGGVSAPRGRFLTTGQTVRQIDSSSEARSMLNLPEGATAEKLNAFVIPEGTRVYYGRVEGGGDTATQLFIRDPSLLVRHD